MNSAGTVVAQSPSSPGESRPANVAASLVGVPAAVAQHNGNGLFNLSVVIENADKMEQAYIRTRHNNLRCFPQCGKIHKTKSFCGTPLYVRIKRLDGTQQWQVKELQVIGEFRNVRKPAAFSLMAVCTSKNIDQGAFVPGHLSGTNDDVQFTINPPRKWRYRARIAQVLDMHVFTVYVVAGDRVVAIKDTPQFQVIPIWKADESMLKPGDDEEGVEDDDENDAEEEVVSSTSKANLTSPRKKSRSSFDEDVAGAPPPRGPELAMKRNSSVGSLQDHHQDVLKSFPSLNNLQQLQSSSPFSGLNPMPQLSPNSQLYNSNPFFQGFPLHGAPSNPFTSINGHSQLSSWQPMAAPAFPSLAASYNGHNGNGHGLAGVNVNGGLSGAHGLGATNAANALGSGGASPSLQNTFLNSLLNKAYIGNQALNSMLYQQHQAAAAQGLGQLAGAANGQASTTSSSSMAGFPSSLTGQTVNLASGKNAKEKHQD